MEELFSKESPQPEMFEEQVKKEPIAEPSEKNVSAQGALISNTGSDLFDIFSGLSGLDDEERRAALSEMTDSTFNLAKETSQAVASQMLLNPDMSDQEREAIVLAMAGMEKPSSMVLAMESLAVKDNGEEDLVSEGQRMSLAEVSAGIEKRYEHRQKVMNAHILTSDNTIAETVFDFLEWFVPFTDSVATTQMVNGFREMGAPGVAKALTLIGSAKTDLRELYQSLDSDNQMLFEQHLAKILGETKGVVFTNDNQLLKKDMFMQIVDGTYYEDWEVALDNLAFVADAVGLGMALAPAKMSNAARKLKARAMRAGVQPASPIKVASDVNPSEARKLQQVAEADPTDATATVTHGTTREEAIVDMYGPQINVGDGSLESKPAPLINGIEEHIQSGHIEFSLDEIASAQEEAERKLQGVTGLTNRTNMATYKAPVHRGDGTTQYQNVYGPGDSSYTSPEEGIKSVLFHLRDYNVQESDLTVLRRVGDEYVPTTVKEVEANKVIRDEIVKKKKKLPDELKKENLLDDYLIQVNFEHKFDPNDVEFDKLQVKRNYFDYIPYFNKAKKGSASLQRHFIDAHSMLDPRITLGANVAVERASAIETVLIKNAEQFVNPYQKLAPERQEALLNVIKKHNADGKFLPYRTLRATLEPEEIDLLYKWKNSWDQLYHLENMDMVRSLRSGGYQKFIDEADGTELIARPIARVTANKIPGGKVYDSEMGIVRYVDADELTRLYEGNGTIAALRSAEKINGQEFSHVIVKNAENKSQLRQLRDSDRVLNYREGYYSVRYKDPHIIVKEVVDAEGKVIETKAVKTAGNMPDAEQMVNELMRSRKTGMENVRYRFRDNRDRTIGQMEDDYWEIQSTNGRTAQRLRGQRLGSDSVDELGGSVIGKVEGPAEALLNSVRSISRRTSMREYLDNVKLRFMDEYGDLIRTNPTNGQLIFPRSADDFVLDVSASNKRIADARTTLEYINYLENGYRSTLDDSWKALLNGLADGLGHLKLGKSEEFVRAVADEVANPTGWFKARAFDAYLALNPLRQFVVQGHQASLLAANFPKYVLSQELARDMMGIHMAMIMGDKIKNLKGFEKLVGKSADEILDLAEEYRLTGFDATIDRNNLVEKGLDNLVETEHFKTAKKAHRVVVGSMRKVGFDAGERINIMSSWLAHRHKALEGLNNKADIKSRRVQDEVIAKARNYTFNMNAAGDMPYNKNSLALLFQFMQVPHKAMLQMTNRALSRAERARLAAYNAVMLPLPVGLGYSIIADWEIEDKDARDLIANGLEGFLFNKLAQASFGDDTQVDFSSLAAVDPNAIPDLIHGILTTDIGEILSNAPSLSLWAGHNPRATEIIKETWKFVSEPTDIDLDKSLALMNTFASFSSGYMNLSKSYKELLVQEYDRRYNSVGAITDTELTTPEMFAKALGFGSLQEAYSRETKSRLYLASKEAREDAKEIYNAQKKLVAKQGINVDNPQWSHEMLRAFWTAGDFSLAMKEEYLKAMSRDARNQEDGVMNMILRNVNTVDVDTLREAAYGSGYQGKLEETLRYIDELSKQRLGE